MPKRRFTVVLWPLAALYSGVVRARTWLYRRGILRQRRLGGTVISVGNITVGGTGKTPIVLWLAERLVAEKQRPAILTRGYRGGAHADARGIPLADEVALLRGRMGARAQLGVGKNRYEAGRTLERHGAKWFILDDGFQHLALYRDADVVLLDATNPFGGGWLLPVGRLREPRTALERADVIVITRADHAPAVESLARRFSSAAIFYAHTELEAVLRAPAMVVALGPAERERVKFFAFCGIGNPMAFFEDVRRWGFSIAGQRSFRDHHRYTADDVRRLEMAAAAAGADAMICTEKDAYNLRSAFPAALPIYACRIRLVLSDGEGFWRAVLDAAERRRSRERGADVRERTPREGAKTAGI